MDREPEEAPAAMPKPKRKRSLQKKAPASNPRLPDSRPPDSSLVIVLGDSDSDFEVTPAPVAKPKVPRASKKKAQVGEPVSVEGPPAAESAHSYLEISIPDPTKPEAVDGRVLAVVKKKTTASSKPKKKSSFQPRAELIVRRGINRAFRLSMRHVHLLSLLVSHRLSSSLASSPLVQVHHRSELQALDDV